MISYFSLASGFLTGKYRSSEDLTDRARADMVKKYLVDRATEHYGPDCQRHQPRATAHVDRRDSRRVGPLCDGPVDCSECVLILKSSGSGFLKMTESDEMQSHRSASTVLQHEPGQAEVFRYAVRRRVLIQCLEPQRVRGVIYRLHPIYPPARCVLDWI